MDLIPKPDQVVAAAGNVAHKLLYGGLADLRPMPTHPDRRGRAARGLPLPASGVTISTGSPWSRTPAAGR